MGGLQVEPTPENGWAPSRARTRFLRALIGEPVPVIYTEEVAMAQQATSKKEGPLAYVLPALPYAPDALEPFIDKQTMEIHHGKHHGTYVNNLNKALEGHADLQTLSIDELMKSLDRVPEAIRTAVRNNGGGHWNHSMFWKIMKKGG